VTQPEPSTSVARVVRRRQWANCRRPRPSHTAAAAAADNISALTDSKRAYYEAKLAMKKKQHELLLQEHAKRMQLLDLQQKMAIKKLQKLEE